MEKKITKLLNAFNKNRRSILITSAAGIIIFSTLIILVWNYILSREKDIFRYQSDIIQERLIGNIITGETVANSIIALYHSSTYVSASEFRIFMDEIFKRYNFINSVYYYNKRNEGNTFYLAYSVTHDEGSELPVYSVISTSSFNNAVYKSINSGTPIIVPDNSGSSSMERIYILVSEYSSKILPEKISDRINFSNGIALLRINLRDMMQQQKIPEECSYRLELADNNSPENNTVLFETESKKLNSIAPAAFSIADLEYRYETSISGQAFVLTIFRSVTLSMTHFLSFFFVIIIGFLLTAGINTITRKSIRIREQNDDLAEMGDFLTAILNSMSSMLISITRDFSITHWNSAAEKFTGIKAADAMSKNFMDIIEFLQPFRDKILLCMTNNSSEILNHEDVHTGRRRFFNISVFPMTYHKIPGAIIMIDDVSELRIIDNELKQIQKMETIGNLAGGLAHDLNNILGGIYGVTDVLKFKYANNMKVKTSDIEKFLDIIENQSRRAADITDHLLSIAQKSELILNTIDLTHTALSVLDLCRNSFDKRIEIVFNSENITRYIYADATQISQVLLNLCINSSHAMTIMKPENETYGGRLTVSIELFFADNRFKTLHPSDSYNNYYWIVTVSDTGVGIDSQQIEKIFDPFYTTKGNKGGSGLGLSMVYSIIRQHNGFIDVYSEKGIGSSFNIYLPAAVTDAAPSSVSAQEIIKNCGQGKLILIIDDEEIMRNVSRNSLEEYGYSVLLAEDGEEGLKIFNEKHKEISAVLLDMIMPKMSGIDVYRKMRIIDNDVRVLLTSGFRQNEIIEKFLQEINSGFIRKPYSIEKLITEIQKLSK
jgi:PAS domain S-box-containing protein